MESFISKTVASAKEKFSPIRDYDIQNFGVSRYQIFFTSLSVPPGRDREFKKLVEEEVRKVETNFEISFEGMVATIIAR